VSVARLARRPGALLGRSQWISRLTLVSASPRRGVADKISRSSQPIPAGRRVILHRGVAVGSFHAGGSAVCAGVGPAGSCWSPAPPGRSERCGWVGAARATSPISGARQGGQREAHRHSGGPAIGLGRMGEEQSASVSDLTRHSRPPWQSSLTVPTGRRRSSSSTSDATLAERGNLQVVQPHRTDGSLGSYQKPAGALRRVLALAPAARLGSPAPLRRQPKDRRRGSGQVCCMRTRSPSAR